MFFFKFILFSIIFEYIPPILDILENIPKIIYT